MKSVLARVHKFLTLFISLGVLVQMLLAGIWHARVVSTPDAHAMFGMALLLASLLALLAAIFGSIGKQAVTMTGLLFVLILLQPVLIGLRHGGLPALSALHTLNAAFIGMLSGVVMKVGAAATVSEKEAVAMSGLSVESGD